MCYHATSYVGPEAASNLTELGELGWIAGVDTTYPMGEVDPIDGANAVVLSRHPRVLIAEHPELWTIIDRFQSGCWRRLHARDYDRLSAFEISAFLTMRAALGREESRAIERRRKETEAQQ